MFAEETDEGIRFAENGILYVVPYQNPWAWQNKQNVSYTDEIIDVLFNEYDLPRTLYSAFYSYDCSLQEALKSASPLDLVDKMPINSQYYIFHCEEDMAVNKQKHSDRFVEAMKEKHSILYHTVAERGHCDLTDEMKELYYKYIVSSVLDKN